PWPADKAMRPAAPPPPAAAAITAEQRAWWAFRPLAHPAPPAGQHRALANPAPRAVKNGEWPKTDVDRFILAHLEREELEPVKPADRRTLIRRVTLDLTGLSPTPEEGHGVVSA